MTRPDIWLGGVTIVTTILGAILAVHAPTKTWQKITYLVGFVVLGISGIYFVVWQSNETAVANAKLNSALVKLSDSTAQIQESNAAMTRAQERNNKLQQKLLESNATISDLARRGINTSTGGNGFCYLEFGSINGS